MRARSLFLLMCLRNEIQTTRFQSLFFVWKMLRQMISCCFLPIVEEIHDHKYDLGLLRERVPACADMRPLLLVLEVIHTNTIRTLYHGFHFHFLKHKCYLFIF